MAGTSRADLEGFYGELSGNIAAQWGEDTMATIDDKLHMTETASAQTAQGPMNWSNVSMMTFAGPFNATSTGVNTFAGTFNATSTGINTWAGPANFSHTTGPHVFAGPFNATSTAINTFAGPVNASNTNTSTFGGPIKSGSGIVALWDADNIVVTRRYSIQPRGGGVGLLAVLEDDLTNFMVGILSDAAYRINAATGYLGINLPDGAIVTAFRATGTRPGADTFIISLHRAAHSNGAVTDLASVALPSGRAEVSDTSITNATVDNDTYGYVIKFVITNVTGTAKECNGIQIDYTVVRPQP